MDVPVDIMSTPAGTVVCLPAWLLGLLAVLLAGGSAISRWRRRERGQRRR
jgi:hypothetical protein